MIPLQVVTIVLVATAAAAVVATRDPLRQVFANGFLGLAMMVLFLLFQAPDVVLSLVGVSAFGFPILTLLTLAKMRRDDDDR